MFPLTSLSLNLSRQQSVANNEPHRFSLKTAHCHLLTADWLGGGAGLEPALSTVETWRIHSIILTAHRSKIAKLTIGNVWSVVADLNRCFLHGKQRSSTKLDERHLKKNKTASPFRGGLLPA